MANANETSPARKNCSQCGSRQAAPEDGRCRCCILEAEASQAFWAIIARHFPEAKYGDLSPERTVRQIRANADAIEEWIGNNVPPEDTKPRRPTAEELRQLADWLLGQGCHEDDEAISAARSASVAVYDAYCTDCPGYGGKLMSVVWSGSPSFFDVFTWKDGKPERACRDDDRHQCGRCGSKNGALCRTCWQARQS